MCLRTRVITPVTLQVRRAVKEWYVQDLIFCCKMREALFVFTSPDNGKTPSSFSFAKLTKSNGVGILDSTSTMLT